MTTIYYPLTSCRAFVLHALFAFSFFFFCPMLPSVEAAGTSTSSPSPLWFLKSYDVFPLKARDVDKVVGELPAIAQAGATGLTLSYLISTANETSNSVHSHEATPSRVQFTTIFEQCHRLNLTVYLKPAIVTENGKQMTDLQPQNKSLWFANYTAYIVREAAFFQSFPAVALLSVGLELLHLTVGEENANYWRHLIASVRAVYNSPKLLTYSAVHAPPLGSEMMKISWWSSLDVIGADMYVSLQNCTQWQSKPLFSPCVGTTATRPSLNAMRGVMQKSMADARRWRDSLEKTLPFLMSETGYPSWGPMGLILPAASMSCDEPGPLHNAVDNELQQVAWQLLADTILDSAADVSDSAKNRTAFPDGLVAFAWDLPGSKWSSGVGGGKIGKDFPCNWVLRGKPAFAVVQSLFQNKAATSGGEEHRPHETLLEKLGLDVLTLTVVGVVFVLLVVWCCCCRRQRKVDQEGLLSSLDDSGGINSPRTLMHRLSSARLVAVAEEKKKGSKAKKSGLSGEM